jgi:hypothetical protein
MTLFVTLVTEMARTGRSIKAPSSEDNRCSFGAWICCSTLIQNRMVREQVLYAGNPSPKSFRINNAKTAPYGLSFLLSIEVIMKSFAVTK